MVLQQNNFGKKGLKLLVTELSHTVYYNYDCGVNLLLQTRVLMQKFYELTIILKGHIQLGI